MDLRELTTFQTVAHTLNFTRAAEMLGYAQSSISAQIQSLEAEFGVPLFNRLGRRISLTEAGTRLLDYSGRILALSTEARDAIASVEPMAGNLTITAPESVFTYRLPAILQTYRTDWPQVRLVFKPMPVAAMYDALREGSVDFAFLLENQITIPGLSVEPLSTEALSLLAAPNHALVDVSKITANDLQDQTLLLTENGCQYRNDFEHNLGAMGVRGIRTLEFASIEAIKQCVMAGLGIAYLPTMTVVDLIERKQLTELSWPAAQLNLQIAYHKDKWISPMMRAFLDVCRRVYDVQHET